jgi:NAD(P)-dependent dehydrogenase (short-subunit alcohol dehydrogenase family)
MGGTQIDCDVRRGSTCGTGQTQWRSRSMPDKTLEELAPAYVFLASPQMSSYITGEILPVVGGH